MRRRIPPLAVALRLLLLPAASVVPPTAFAADPSQSRLLGTRLPDLRLDAVTLRDALDFLRDSAGLNLHVNWRAMEGAGVAADTPVTLRLRNVAARKALQSVLNEAAGDAGLLTYYVAENVVHVTTRDEADRQHVTRVYPVGDLLVNVPNFADAPDLNVGGGGGGGGRGRGGSSFGGGGGSRTGLGSDEQTTTRAEREQALVDLITSTVSPDVWQQNGGTATIVLYHDRLIVTAPRSVHQQLGR